MRGSFSNVWMEGQKQKWWKSVNVSKIHDKTTLVYILHVGCFCFACVFLFWYPCGVYHEQQDVAGDGDVKRLEAVDGGESRQLHQRVRISEDRPRLSTHFRHHTSRYPTASRIQSDEADTSIVMRSWRFRTYAVTPRAWRRTRMCGIRLYNDLSHRLGASRVPRRVYAVVKHSRRISFRLPSGSRAITRPQTSSKKRVNHSAQSFNTSRTLLTWYLTIYTAYTIPIPKKSGRSTVYRRVTVMKY